MSPRETPRGGVRRRARTRPGAHRPRTATHPARRLLLAFAAGLLVALTLLAPAHTLVPSARAGALADAQAELEQARAQLDAMYAKVDGVAARYAKAQSGLETTQDRIAEVQTKAATAKKDLSTVQGRLRQRVRRIYMDGSGSMAFVESLVAEHTTLLSLLNRLDLLQRVAKQDQSLFTQVADRLDTLHTLDDELQTRKADEQRLAADLTAANDEAMRMLEASKDDYRTLRARVKTLEAQEAALRAQEEAKAQVAANGATTKTTTKRPGSSGGGRAVGGSSWVFPVQGPNSFVNDWGFPRAGGRSHQGTDIMSPRGTPVVAVVSGTVGRARPVETGIGGITIWLDGSDGNSYYYAHLSAIESGITSGTRVGAGQVVGYVGNTGDARSTDPHLHFQIHPGGGSPINPYPTLVAHR